MRLKRGGNIVFHFNVIIFVVLFPVALLDSVLMVPKKKKNSKLSFMAFCQHFSNFHLPFLIYIFFLIFFFLFIFYLLFFILLGGLFSFPPLIFICFFHQHCQPGPEQVSLHHNILPSCKVYFVGFPNAFLGI